MNQQTPNGRLSITLREGDAAVVTLPDGDRLLVHCRGASPSAVQVSVEPPEEDEGYLLQRRGWDHAYPFVCKDEQMMICKGERFELVTPAQTQIEVYCSHLDWDRATFAIEAPREYRISRIMRDEPETQAAGML